jgi:hypothetical protein
VAGREARVKTHRDVEPAPIVILATHIIKDISELCAWMAIINRHEIQPEHRAGPCAFVCLADLQGHERQGPGQRPGGACKIFSCCQDPLDDGIVVGNGACSDSAK